MDGGVGFQSTGGAEGTKDQSYSLRIGMDGDTERCTIVKGPWKVCSFRCNLQESSLKDTVLR